MKPTPLTPPADVGNKIIADFDGNLTKMIDGELLCSSNNGKSWYGKLYDKDWNKLMAIIEKINDLALDNYGEIGVIIYPGKTDVVTGSDCNEMIIEGMTGNSFIDSAWQTVVQFIQWYNINKVK